MYTVKALNNMNLHGTNGQIFGLLLNDQLVVSALTFDEALSLIDQLKAL